jgi:hypothetical protein
MSRRTGIIAFLVVALVGVAALLVAAGSDKRATAFSEGVPVSALLPAFEPGQSVCQGPIPVSARFGAIQGYLATDRPPGGGLLVSVRAAGGGLLASGRVSRRFATEMIFDARLDHVVGAGRSVTVCFRSTGPERLALIGDVRINPAVRLTVAGKPSAEEASLVFLRPKPRSLLALIPTVFARASLFRPGWVGTWTFWLLAALLLAGFAFGALAIAQADRESSASTSER